jgi:hypothetical protein
MIDERTVMVSYNFIVFSNPVDGRELAYNDWYDNVHLGEVLAVPGFVAADRFRVLAKGEETPRFGYVAIYQMDTHDPRATLSELTGRAARGEIRMSDALGSVETILVEKWSGSPA